VPFGHGLTGEDLQVRRITPYLLVGQLIALTVGAAILSLLEATSHVSAHLTSKAPTGLSPSVDWAFIGDVLVLVGILVAAGVYLRQRFDSDLRQIDATLAVLHSVRRGMAEYGDMHFGGHGYDREAATTRSQIDHDCIMDGIRYQNFRVPTEPVISLIQQPEEGWFISRETLEAANIALWRIGQFNQMVQQQTDLLANSLPGITNKKLPIHQREALAEAARKISFTIHFVTIGDSGWYHQLMDSIDQNVETLQDRRRRKWWSRRWRAHAYRIVRVNWAARMR